MSDFTLEDWNKFFRSNQWLPTTIVQNKKIYYKFLSEYYPNQIKSLKLCKESGYVYITDFDELQSKLEEYKEKMIKEKGELNTLYHTPMAIAYLAWLGFKAEEVCRLKLTDYDIQNHVFTFEDNEIEVKEKEMAGFLDMYAKSVERFFYRNDELVSWKYQQDTFIRTVRKNPITIKSLYVTFPDDITFYNVWVSARMREIYSTEIHGIPVKEMLYDLDRNHKSDYIQMYRLYKRQIGDMKLQDSITE